jgi:hypothetical protein
MGFTHASDGCEAIPSGRQSSIGTRPGFGQFQAVEEPGDLAVAAHDEGLLDGLVVAVAALQLGHLLGLDVGGEVRQRQPAPRRHRLHEPSDDAGGVVLIGEEVRDRHQDHRDRTGEVERVGGVFKDRFGIAQVPEDVGRCALGRALQQLVGVG